VVKTIVIYVNILFDLRAKLLKSANVLRIYSENTVASI